MADSIKIETSGFIKPTIVSDENKVTLANASNKTDVYPITYANCVKISENETLDELLKKEREEYNNTQFNELVTKINNSIDQLNNKDNAIDSEISKIKDDVNKKIDSVGDGLVKQASGDGQQVSLSLGSGLYVNQGTNQIQLKIAAPLYFDNDGNLCIRLGNGLKINNSGQLTVGV